MRFLTVHFIDWSVTAAGYSSGHHAAVIKNNKVVACSVAARGSGVVAGMKRREAQNIDTDLRIIDFDGARDVHVFEPIVESLMKTCSALEIVEPGTCIFPSRSLSKYYGGDAKLVAVITKLLAKATKRNGGIFQLGVADSQFASFLAAKSSSIVEPLETKNFLSDFSIDVIEDDRIVSLLKKLGVTTLGKFAEISEQNVEIRFGKNGVKLHRQANGLEQHDFDPLKEKSEIDVSINIDPPTDRVDITAFYARKLAIDLIQVLNNQYLTCDGLAIEITTEQNEVLRRHWKHKGLLTEKVLLERLRWQLEGWLQSRDRPKSNISKLCLVPYNVHSNNGEQRDLWNSLSLQEQKVERGLLRLQSLLGSDAVQIPEVQGGRHPREKSILRTWGQSGNDVEKLPSVPPLHVWPNEIPPPSPEIVYKNEEIVELFDDFGEEVMVSSRGVVSGEPRALQIGNRTERVVTWNGPWTLDEKWWDLKRAKRQAFMQVVTDSGNAYLVVVRGQRWLLSGTYQ